MAKKKKKDIGDADILVANAEPQIPLSAVPHLFNASMLKWQKAHFEALKAIHEELVKLNKETV